MKKLPVVFNVERGNIIALGNTDVPLDACFNPVCGGRGPSYDPNSDCR